MGALIWKTDWTAGDNHARDGGGDITRLVNNYTGLKQQLENLGHFISFQDVSTNGYLTYPFADVLNAIEYNLKGLRALEIEWIEKNVTWLPAEPGPAYEDINRWEKNGQAIEGAVNRLTQIFRYCNDAYCGG